MKNLFLVITAAILMKASCMAGSMDTSLILRAGNGSLVMYIHMNSDGVSSAYYTGPTANAQTAIIPAADGSFSFPVKFAPDTYSWQVDATARANDPSLYAAPYNELASDNANTDYTVYFSANPSDGVTILSSLSHTINIDGTAGDYDPTSTWTTSYNNGASTDGNLQWGSATGSGTQGNHTYYGFSGSSEKCES